MNSPKNVIGSKIRAKRLTEKPPATQHDISARLELYNVRLSASSIGKIKNGTRPLTDVQIIAFAKALKVAPEWFFRNKR